MSIQVLKPKYRIEECLLEIKDCLEKGWTGLGFKTKHFEEQWCEYTKLNHAHFLSSNTVGLHLAFNLFKSYYGWQDHDEIITTPLTFISTNHAILYEKLRPVFADIDNTLCLDPKSIQKKITGKTKAICYVGVGGNVGRLDDIVNLCNQYNLKLVLDAAHMAGTRYRNKHVGEQADVTVFSFQAVKNLPTADAGMICFRDPILDAQVRKMSWLGINQDTYTRTVTQGNYKWQYDVENVGFKYHGNSIMAAMGIVGLKYLDEDNQYRRELAAEYEQQLKNVPFVSFIEKIPDCESAQHLFQIRVQKRDKLIEHLQRNNVFPGVHYRDNTEYTIYQHESNFCPIARQISQEIITLPLHLYLTKKNIEYISNLIKDFNN